METFTSTETIVWFHICNFGSLQNRHVFLLRRGGDNPIYPINTPSPPPVPKYIKLTYLLISYQLTICSFMIITNTLTVVNQALLP